MSQILLETKQMCTWSNISNLKIFCSTRITGDRCQIKVDECGGCQNGGTCRNTINGNVCECPDQWFGPKCEQQAYNLCDRPDLCTNGGTCKANEYNGSCECPPGRYSQTLFQLTSNLVTVFYPI